MKGDETNIEKIVNLVKIAEAFEKKGWKSDVKANPDGIPTLYLRLEPASLAERRIWNRYGVEI